MSRAMHAAFLVVFLVLSGHAQAQFKGVAEPTRPPRRWRRQRRPWLLILGQRRHPSLQPRALRPGFPSSHPLMLLRPQGRSPLPRRPR